MKGKFFLSTVLIVLALFPGCKKDKDSTESLTPGFSVKIGGVLWNPAVYAGFYDSSQDISLIVASTTDVTRQLQIAFKGQGTGTYTISPSDVNTFGTYADINLEEIYTTIGEDAGGGQIIITKYDMSKHLISGTFHFDAINTMDDQPLAFTEGTFNNVPFEEQ